MSASIGTTITTCFTCRAHGVTGGILWANLHLLFWLSLVPLASAWMGESNFAAVPVALYGVLLLMCGFAYYHPGAAAAAP